MHRVVAVYRSSSDGLLSDGLSQILNMVSRTLYGVNCFHVIKRHVVVVAVAGIGKVSMDNNVVK